MGFKALLEIFTLVACINSIQSATVTLDVVADLKAPWVDQCDQGYHELESFVCGGLPMIPAGDYHGTKGYWAKCGSLFVPSCKLVYRPTNTETLKEVRIEAYFVGNAILELVVQDSNGFTTGLFTGNGWTTVSLDMSGLTGIREISISPEYHEESFAVIDKIIVDDKVTITTTTTPAPSTTPSTTPGTGPTTVQSTSAPSSVVPTSAVPSSSAAPSTAPPATTNAPVTSQATVATSDPPAI